MNAMTADYLESADMQIFRMSSIVFVAALVVGGLAVADDAKQPAPAQNQVMKDIEKTFGFVPQFFREVPASMLPGFWETMKNFQMGKTSLDGKTKELIGLAVASQIPCEYCVLFHTEAARMNGASDEEVKEAIGMAAMTRMGSTVLNGRQIDYSEFKRDVARIMKHAREAKLGPAQQGPSENGTPKR
jgi:AhpD family alkylhydroperoxidase